MESIYENMWQHSLPILKNGKVQTDPLIHSNNDSRRGLTLLFRPPAHILQIIKSFLDQAHSLEPNQYFYPVSDIHLTILSIISCNPDFELSQIDREEYIRVIKNSLYKIAPFKLIFKGISASPGTVMIQGFEEKGKLELLRNTLRNNFKKSLLRHSIDKRYKIQTAHLTVIRFKEQLIQPEPFLSLLKKNRNTVFGSCIAEELELVYNDWYLKKEIVKKLGTYIIKSL